MGIGDWGLGFGGWWGGGGNPDHKKTNPHPKTTKKIIFKYLKK